MWPDLPMPLTITRPRQLRMSSTARSKILVEPGDQAGHRCRLDLEHSRASSSAAGPAGATADLFRGLSWRQQYSKVSRRGPAARPCAGCVAIRRR